MTTSTYAAWVSWLEAFRRGEDPPTEHLSRVGAGLGSYVEARLLDRIAGAFGERVRQWQTSLGRRIVAAPPRDAAEAQVILRDAVQRLEPLARLAASPLLPRPLGVSLHAALGEVRDGARSALEDAWRRRVEADADTATACGTATSPTRRGAGVPQPRTSTARAVSRA